MGWRTAWEWCPPGSQQPTFGALSSGGCELFLCQDGQGGRGREGGIGGDGQGVWLSVFVDDVDLVFEVCQRHGMEVPQPPRDEPWGVREMHVRHPEGHVLRVGHSLESDTADHAHPHPHDHDHPHTA